jgi:serine/threonine protein kinase
MGVVKISDFGIASIVIRSKDTTSAQTQGKQSAVHHVLGSLAYLPPELSLRSSTGTGGSPTPGGGQSSSSSRPVDYRSDFYSLGVTFFELLCGAPPFRERSAVRMMHAHMAKQPPLVHEIDVRVPRCLSAVVNRLLAKSVEARYQSSRGLVADLQRCEAVIAARARADSAEGDAGARARWAAEAEELERSFVPGEDDVSDVFSFPGKLYGREEEIARLSDIYRTLSPSHPRNQVCTFLSAFFPRNALGVSYDMISVWGW